MKLANIWTDGVVVQQKKKIRIAGSASANAAVTVLFERELDGYAVGRKTVKAGDDGRFVCKLPALEASYDTYKLTCSEPAGDIVVRDILVGEVWLASGQSNMAVPAAFSMNSRELMAKAVTDKVRFIQIPSVDERLGGKTERPVEPLADLPYGGWIKADRPDRVADVSAIALAFAFRLHESLRIPVGILCTAVGGTTIEAWLPRESIEQDAKLRKHLQKTGRYVAPEQFNRAGDGNYTQMSGLYNEKIAPLTAVNIAGVIWLQGESSAGDAAEANYYRRALDKLIHSWNKRFRDKSQPFVFAHIAAQNYQIAPYGVPYVNEAFDDVWRKNKHFAIQVPIYDVPLDWIMPDDIDNSHPIHPIVKFPIGERMALLALGKVYGNSEACAPALVNTVKKGNKMVLTFEGAGAGLQITDGGTLRGFTVCGPDGRHIEAIAEITDRNTIEIYNEYVEEPSGVTYAFSTFNQNSNLANSDGIPAVPFRTGRKGEQYATPRPWMSCDCEHVWVNRFEWALGGAGDLPLWSVSGLFGSRKASLSWDRDVKSEGESSIRIDYETEPDSGWYFGVSPAVNLIGYPHQLQYYDFLTFDLHNPDNREKTFVGVNLKTSNGKTYLLPIVENGDHRPNVAIPPKSGFIRFQVSLNTFLGCYLMEERKDPGDVSDVVEMQWTFRDKQSGTLYLDNIRAGWGVRK